MKRLLPLTLAILALLIVGPGRAEEPAEFVQPTPEHPLKVKVAVLTMFQIGADNGDKPGEYRLWVERRKLDHIIPLPTAYHDVRADDKGVIATVTGMGAARAAVSVTALGLDPRFDFAGLLGDRRYRRG